MSSGRGFGHRKLYQCDMLIACSSMRGEVPQKQCYIEVSVDHNFSMIHVHEFVAHLLTWPTRVRGTLHVSILKGMNAVSENKNEMWCLGLANPNPKDK
jgi:hypothetical protein